MLSDKWSNRKKYLPWLLLIVLIVAGSWLRLTNLTRTSLWFDEYLTFDEAMRPTISEAILVTASHPPLQRLLIRFAAALFGSPDRPGGYDFAIRLPSALLGIVAIVFIYLFAARAASSAYVGLVAAALWALGPYGIYYSQEGRFYSGMVLFTAWALHGLLLWRDRPYSLACGIYFTIALLLGSYNHCLFGFIFVLSFLSVLPAISKGPLRQWYLALPWLISGSLFLPWFLYAIGHLENQARPWIPNVLIQLVDIPMAIFTGRFGLFHLEYLNENILGRNALCLWILVFIIYAVRQRGKKNTGSPLCLISASARGREPLRGRSSEASYGYSWPLATVLLLIPIITLVTTVILHEASVKTRYFHPKYLAFLYPFACLWFAEALAYIFDVRYLQQLQSWWYASPRARFPRPVLRWGVISLVLLSLLGSLVPAMVQAHERMWPGSAGEFHKEQYREAVSWIEAHREQSPVYVFEQHWESNFRWDLITSILRYYGAKERLSPIIVEDVQSGSIPETIFNPSDNRVIYVAIHPSLENAETVGTFIRTRYPVLEQHITFPGCEGTAWIWVYSLRRR